MIATEAQISGLDQTRKEYYDYLSSIYGEIATYLKIQDGSVNAQKLELMFEKTASPYVYWREANDRERKPEQGKYKSTATAAPASTGTVGKQVGGSELTREEIVKLLDALKAKYSLQKSGEEFKLTKGLPPEGFETLKKAMMDAGYVYSRDSRSFRKEGVR